MSGESGPRAPSTLEACEQVAWVLDRCGGRKAAVFDVVADGDGG